MRFIIAIIMTLALAGCDPMELERPVESRTENFLATDTICYITEVTLDEVSGYIGRIRMSGADSLISAELHVTWTNKVADLLGYHLHPSMTEDSTFLATVQQDTFRMSYFNYDVSPWGIPEHGSVVSFHFSELPGELDLYKYEFTTYHPVWWLQPLTAKPCEP